MRSWLFRELTDTDDAVWDAFVEESPQGNAFLASSTLRLLASNEHPVATVRRVGGFSSEGVLDAGWAVLVRKRMGIRYCSSFPLFYAGPMLSSVWNKPDHSTKRMDLLYGLARIMLEGLDVLDTETDPSLPDVRGFIYADCLAEQIYTHIWPPLPSDALRKRMNRSKRQEANRSAKLHQFGWREATPDLLNEFDRLHNLTLKKFKWIASPAWRSSLLRNMAELESSGTCRLFAAAPAEAPEFPCAIVSVLFSPARKTAWLWRVAYQTDDSGLIPALYTHVAEAIHEIAGEPWTINFGGSPHLSLARFKEYLGSDPAPHWRIQWQRPGRTMWQWEVLLSSKEFLRKHLTLLSARLPSHPVQIRRRLQTDQLIQH